MTNYFKQRMTEPAIKAMIQLMDDSDQEVVHMVETQIRTLGPSIIPILESEWENLSLNPVLQNKIENLIFIELNLSRD